MKLEWNEPVLEELDVKETAESGIPGGSDLFAETS
ncbi:paeninodin family lasso peptide [Exiguobacterium aestuarii]|uniref:Paeninodin family lasso peptide n=1 Tax=Exiguobacterium aestuarii TaxID=273527 RepID=A0ABW2PLJ6_9BACL|nr:MULTISPECIES: paeninodin family lasso peptide [Exiguobacterium]MCT4785130.1 paeninodin family lasso peptide [Exiguobacterium aestuarii]